MSKFCDYCERGPHIVIVRSHSHTGTKRWQKINLQYKTIDGKRVRICTKCLKTLSKKSTKKTKKA